MKRITIVGAVMALSFVAMTTTLSATTVHAQDQADTTAQSQPATSSNSDELVKTEYTVQAGDYLDAIAQDHHISWPSIYELNTSIDNPDLIYPDQKLEIPNHDVPLTRVVPQNSTLQIPTNYNPQPVAATQTQAPKQVVHQATVQPAIQAAITPVASAVIGGVPGLSLVMGRPYVFGGTSPATGFDCSGLTQFLAAQKGIAIPRTAAGQYSALRHITIAQALPGDIIVFNMNHVGTYLGGGMVVHALNPTQGIRQENLQSAIRYNGFLTALAVGH